MVAVNLLIKRGTGQFIFATKGKTVCGQKDYLKKLLRKHEIKIMYVTSSWFGHFGMPENNIRVIAFKERYGTL